MFNYFPEYADLRTPEKAGISLRHLLMMSSGLEWNEYLPYTDPNNSEIAMLRSGHRWRFALQPRQVVTPGLHRNYSSGCTELLGAVIRKAAGKPIEAFAQEALFSPLGITDVQWSRYPDQIPAAASGLQLRSRDIAKLGQLVLQSGLWDHRQIVSRQWLDEATAPQIGPADRITFYGHHWWLGRSASDLVCVVTAGHYDSPAMEWLPLLIFNRYVLPALA